MMDSVGAAVATRRSMMMRIESARRRISTRRDVIWSGDGSCQRPVSTSGDRAQASVRLGRGGRGGTARRVGHVPIMAVGARDRRPSHGARPECAGGQRSKSATTGAWSLG